MTWNPKNWNTRKKSIAYASTLIVIASGFLVVSAVDAHGVFSPFVNGFEWVTERSLSGHTDSLTVIAGRYVGGETSRLAGATVEVQRMVIGGSGDPLTQDFVEQGSPVTGVTGPDGRIIFELRSGRNMVYEVRITSGAMRADHLMNLDDSFRLGAYFDTAGEAHFREIRHKDLETYGEDVARVYTFVNDPEYCQTDGTGIRRCAMPEPGPHIEAFAVRGGKVAERVAETWGGPNRFLVLPIGGYELRVTFEGSTVTTRVDLFADTSVDCHFDASPSCRARESKTPVGWES